MRGRGRFSSFDNIRYHNLTCFIVVKTPVRLFWQLFYYSIMQFTETHLPRPRVFRYIEDITVINIGGVRITHDVRPRARWPFALRVAAAAATASDAAADSICANRRQFCRVPNSVIAWRTPTNAQATRQMVARPPSHSHCEGRGERPPEADEPRPPGLRAGDALHSVTSLTRYARRRKNWYYSGNRVWPRIVAL